MYNTNCSPPNSYHYLQQAKLPTHIAAVSNNPFLNRIIQQSNRSFKLLITSAQMISRRKFFSRFIQFVLHPLGKLFQRTSSVLMLWYGCSTYASHRFSWNGFSWLLLKVFIGSGEPSCTTPSPRFIGPHRNFFSQLYVACSSITFLSSDWSICVASLADNLNPWRELIRRVLSMFYSWLQKGTQLYVPRKNFAKGKVNHTQNVI